MSWTPTVASNFSTSFGPSTTYARSKARDSSLSNGYTHKAGLSGSRPLPIGPGPLDSGGKKLSNYSVGLTTSGARRNVTTNGTTNGIASLRNGPLRANHGSSFNTTTLGKHAAASDYSRHTSGYGSTSRRSPISSVVSPVSNGSVFDGGIGGGGVRGTTTTTTRPRSGTLRPSRSSSLVDLTQLNIDSSPSPAYRSNRTGSNNNPSSVALNNDRSYLSRVTSDKVGHLDRNNNDDARHYHLRDVHGGHRFESSSNGGSFSSSNSERNNYRSGYTPSISSRETSPTTNNAYTSGRRGVAVERGDDSSPSKSSLSNQSSSSSMSNGSYSDYTSSGSSTSRSSPYRGARAVTSKYRDGGKVGLKNLGNTCFMNAVLQSLSNTRCLLEWCLEENYHLDINTTTSSMKGLLIKAYASLMQSLWKEKNNSFVSPNNFKTQIQKFAPRFMGYAQQDSQEFLRYLLEGLHEDVNRVTRKPAPIILDDNVLEKKSDNGKAQDYWKAYLNRDNSQIVDIFVGQLKSELKFTSCGHRSVTFDPFWDLSLPIPKNRSDVNIADCIRLFMKEEELAAEERPNCAKCKERRSCLKMFSIQKFPKILVLHLKRFSQERFGRKLTTLVDFPLTGLDLTEYSAEARSGGRRVLYDLYAVSNHSGGTGSGHYTAYCKNPYTSEWLFFNDSRVSSARSNQVVSSEAYIIFYELSSS